MSHIDLKWEKPWRISSKVSSKGIDLKGLPTPAELDVERAVYVISFRPPHFVRYLKANSPVCYIGSGRGWRIVDHQGGWLYKVPTVLRGVEQFKGYELYGCRPRQRGNPNAYKKVEDDLITLFWEKYGERPLFNRMGGNSDFGYHFVDDMSRATKDAIKIFSCQTKTKLSFAIESLGRQLKKH